MTDTNIEAVVHIPCVRIAGDPDWGDAIETAKARRRQSLSSIRQESR